MYRFWGSITKQVFEALKPQCIVEIGCEDGKNTSNLLQYCVRHNAEIHVIDVQPLFDVATWTQRHAGRLHVHRGKSLDILPQLPAYDAALIDGDHNWYTVYNELRCIEQHMVQHGTNVLVMLHDVDWPYARRDMYYNPENIPPEYRQPHCRGGLMPERKEPQKDRGINPQHFHAAVEGGERNGVLTAVEDFLKQSTYPWKLICIPGLNGLGILAPERLLQARPALSTTLSSLETPPALKPHLQLLLDDSVRNFLSALDSNIHRTKAVHSIGNALALHVRQMLPKGQQVLLRSTSDHGALWDAFHRNHFLVRRCESTEEVPAQPYDVLIYTEQALRKEKDLRTLHEETPTGSLLCLLAQEWPSQLAKQNQQLVEQLTHHGWVPTEACSYPGISIFWKTRPVDIVIPIHNAYKQTVRCVESVLKHTKDVPHHIVLIDDCSTDARMLPYLRSVASAHPHVTLIAQQENLGFVRTANTGLPLHTDRDVVLLNSDTEVTEGWLRSITLTAYEKPDCASAIPLSNEASVYSLFREHMGTIRQQIGLDRLTQIIIKHSLKLRPEIPTAVGFCMFLKRDALMAIGVFDTSYGMGYGEENDWCMRARRAGYRHYLADDCFVYHEGHVSMRAAGLVQEEQTTDPRNEAILSVRFPEYKPLIKEYLRQDRNMHAIRNQYSKVTVQSLSAGKKRVAHLLHVHPFSTIGGTQRHVQDLMTQAGDGYCSLAIFPEPGQKRLTVLEYAKGLQHSSYFPLSSEKGEHNLREVFEEILKKYSADLLHVHHCWHTSFGLIEVAKKLHIPVVFSVHDYYALSPNFNLLQRDGTYQGVPKDEEYYDEFLPLSYSAWRRPIRQALSQTDGIVAPSRSALALFDQVYGNVGGPRYVIEHGTDPLWIRKPEYQKGSTGPICFLGSTQRNAKGKQLAEQVALELAKRGQEVVFLGTEERHWPVLQGHQNIHFHGLYRPDQLSAKLQQIHPRLVCLLSTGPETFGYTLSEAWAAGILAYVTDVGALGERMRREGCGRIAPTEDPVLMAEDICTFLVSENYRKSLHNVQRLRLPTRETMWQAYQRLYDLLLGKACSRLASTVPQQ